MILSHHSVSACQMTKDEKDQSRSLWKHHHCGCLRLCKAISTAVFRGGQGFKMSPVVPHLVFTANEANKAQEERKGNRCSPTSSKSACSDLQIHNSSMLFHVSCISMGSPPLFQFIFHYQQLGSTKPFMAKGGMLVDIHRVRKR